MFRIVVSKCQCAALERVYNNIIPCFKDHSMLQGSTGQSSCQGGARMFPAAVYMCWQTAIHLSYFSVTLALNGFFHEASGAWIYLVHSPDTITGSILAWLSSCLTLSKTEHLNESQASICLVALDTFIPRNDQFFVHPSINWRCYDTLCFKFVIQYFWHSVGTGKNDEWLQFGTISLCS